MPLRGGGVGRLMANAILNFHFDYLKPSLIQVIQAMRVMQVMQVLQVMRVMLVMKVMQVSLAHL